MDIVFEIFLLYVINSIMYVIIIFIVVIFWVKVIGFGYFAYFCCSFIYNYFIFVDLKKEK